MCYFSGREVRIGKNCARGLEYSKKTESTVFPSMDRPRPASNMHIFFAAVGWFASLQMDIFTQLGHWIGVRTVYKPFVGKSSQLVTDTRHEDIY